MAKIIPSLQEIINGRVKPEEGELYLLNQLKNGLDDSYIIYFQPLLNGDFPDIVVFKKNYGIYIIEVKDWNLNNYEYKDGYMYYKDNQIYSPMDQVSMYRKNIMHIYSCRFLISYLKYKLNKILNPHVLINTAVYFHNHDQKYIDNKFKDIKQVHNYKRVEIYGNNNIRELIKKIKKSFSYNRKISFGDIFDEVESLLLPSADLIEQRSQIERINMNQKQKVLSNYTSNYMRKIKGEAGSGKTLVLANLAINSYLATRSRVLILCFNITLVNRIRDMISRQLKSRPKDEFFIINFHSFIIKVAKSLNIESHGLDNFDSVLDMIYLRNNKLHKFDTIIIDEGQDFEEYWFRVIKDKFLAQDGCYAVFADEKQNIYNRLLYNKLPSVNIVGRWNELNKIYRTNSNILQLARFYQKKFLKDKYLLSSDYVALQNGLAVDSDVYFQDNDINGYKVIDIFHQVRKILDKGNTNKGNINDITILGNKISMLREVDYILRQNGFNTMTTFATKEWIDSIEKSGENNDIKKYLKYLIEEQKKFAFQANSGKVKISTIHSFKGWESSAVILILDDLGGLNNDELIYTGITRAKEVLYILSNNIKFNQFAREFKIDNDNRLLI